MRASYRYLFLTLCLLAIAYPASGVEPAKENEACVALAEGDLRIVIATGPLSKDEDISPVRFDRSARIISLQLAGVEYLGAEGMPDDFGLHGIGILGFDEASPGEPFIKPGVGLLRKEGALYRFMRSYELISAFPTRVLERTDTTLTLEQTSSELHGYAYRYTKTYRLHLPSTLVLEYSLTNVGSRSFAFEQYNHNWFSLGLNHPDTSLIIQWPGLHPERTHSWFSEDSDGLRLMENLAGDACPADGQRREGCLGILLRILRDS